MYHTDIDEKYLYISDYIQYGNFSFSYSEYHQSENFALPLMVGNCMRCIFFRNVSQELYWYVMKTRTRIGKNREIVKNEKRK